MPWTRTDRIWLVTNKTTRKITNRDTARQYPEDFDGNAPVIITNPHWTGLPPYFDEFEV